MEQIEPAPIDLGALVAEVFDALRPLADSRGVRLRMDQESLVQVAGDEIRFRQVFINVVDNALKFTPEGGSVEVHVGKRDGTGTVTVEDTGMDIPPEHSPRL